MGTKTIQSTQAQNNFGQILDDVIQNGTRYVIKRRSASVAVMLSLAELERLLKSKDDREKLGNIVKEMSPIYNIGQAVRED